MTNDQLLFAIAIPTVIPTLAVLVGILYSNARFNSVDARFNSIDARFNAMQASIDARFNSMDSRLNSLEQRLANIEATLRRLHEILGAHGADIEMLKKR